MKKLLLLLVSVPYAVYGMEKTAEHFMNFMSMEHNHKQAWFDYKKANVDAKVELMKKHNTELFELKKKHLEAMAKGNKDQAYWMEKLNDMIKLHEAQNNEWKEMCEAQYKKGADIGRTHKLELDAFKKAVAPEEKKEAAQKEISEQKK